MQKDSANKVSKFIRKLSCVFVEYFYVLQTVFLETWKIFSQGWMDYLICKIYLSIKKSEKSKEKLHLLFIEWYNDNQKDV